MLNFSLILFQNKYIFKMYLKIKVITLLNRFENSFSFFLFFKTDIFLIFNIKTLKSFKKY